MAASLKDKRKPTTTPPYQVPSVDVTPDPPIFSLVTTFNKNTLNIAGEKSPGFNFENPGNGHFKPRRL
jgi:hypothetical protein